MPYVGKWLASQDSSLTALALLAFTHVIEYVGREANKKFVTAVLPAMVERAVPGGDALLTQAAVGGLGAIAEHGGKLLSRNAAADVGRKLLAILQRPEARFSSNFQTSETAAVALGKLIVHRGASVDAAVAVPEFLSWLPLRHSDEAPSRAAILCLTQLLEADVAATFGANGAAMPKVLGALSSAYESDGIEQALSARMCGLVKQWCATDQQLLESCSASLTQASRDKIVRMASA